jgi:prepilin-type processing-associated H-X9-DG protein
MLAMETEMKTQRITRGSRALTLTELLVVICVVAVVAVLILPMLARTRTKDGRRSPCVENLKQIALASFVWAGDHGDKFPVQVSVTNWGARELALGGDVAGIFCTMSNELNSPKVLICPWDKKLTAASSFSTGFSDANISYFVGFDVELRNPRMILAGDDNLLVNGKPVQPGFLNLSTNVAVEWTMERHQGVGNFALADGSVQSLSNSSFTNKLQETGVATNRLVIP